MLQRTWPMFFALFCWFGSGCQGCGGSEPLAMLYEKSGAVERDFASTLEQWLTAELGANFQLGDGVQTRTGITAKLKLADGTLLLMQPDTVVRFSKTPPAAQEVGFDVELGSISLQVGRQNLQLTTSFGTVKIESGSSIVLRSSNKQLLLVVELGAVSFGETSVNQGEEILIDFGGVIIEPPSPSAASIAAVPSVVPESSGVVAARVVGQHAQVKGSEGWTSLGGGLSNIQPGTVVKLGRDTKIYLQRQQRKAILSSTGQYVVAPKAGVLVATQSGTVSVGGTVPVRIDVPGGVIVVAPLGRARMTTTELGTQVDVHSARVEIRAKDVIKSIAEGQGGLLSRTGELALQGVGLRVADMNLVVGDSVEVRDPSPPVAIRFLYEKRCPKTGVIQIKRGKRLLQYAANPGQVSLALERGKYRYQLRCLQAEGTLSPVVAGGRIRVSADRGTRKVSTRAPVTKLQADGRTYTVLYQNRLPEVELQWPGAPRTANFQLVHLSPNRKTTMEIESSSHRFASGKLKEGKHVFYFEGAGKLSRRSTVIIAFDNASPAARLTTPATVQIVPGQAVTIAGIALPGSKVFVNEKRVRAGRQGRFSVSTAMPSDRRAIAVSIRHPRLGTHVYLRRVQTP